MLLHVDNLNSLQKRLLTNSEPLVGMVFMDCIVSKSLYSIRSKRISFLPPRSVIQILFLIFTFLLSFQRWTSASSRIFSPFSAVLLHECATPQARSRNRRRRQPHRTSFAPRRNNRGVKAQTQSEKATDPDTDHVREGLDNPALLQRLPANAGEQFGQFLGCFLMGFG